MGIYPGRSLSKYDSNYSQDNNGNLKKDIVKEIEQLLDKVIGKQMSANPDISTYEILKYEPIGKFLIIKIKYPNCTNFEGEKILVYKGISLEELKKQKYIDPHFSSNTKFASPIARFVPTEEGWSMAVVLCKKIGNVKDNSTVSIKNSDKIYTNGIMIAPDGEVLCRIGKSKINWYIKRGLADLISQDPPTIRLKFEPKGRGHKDDLFYLEEKEDRCVISGSTKNLTKHHIVPQCFRKFFPESYKNHSYHDVLLVTRELHDVYEKEADKLKKELSEKYNAPLQGASYTVDKKIKNVVTAAEKLNEEKDLNKNAKRKYTNILKKYYKKEEISQTDIDNAMLLSYKIKDENSVEYGKKIVESVPSLEEFVIMWRKHFVEIMKPQHMPKYWDINRKIDLG